MSKRIEEFIEALEDEISCARNVKSATTALFKGKLIGQMAGHFVYEFSATRIATSEDDTPAEIEIAGRSYNCVIVATKGMEIEIAVQSNLGDTIHSAKLISKRNQVLTRLVERFKGVRTNQSEFFRFAEKVFDGKNTSTVNASIKPQYSFQSHNPPNESQAKAIDNSFRSSLCVIWGPPGTGKTRTIARAVEAHLRHGRRILLVSHANTAVDAALADIASQVSESFYKDGKILRLGVPKDQTLVEEYPLVMIENIILKINADRDNERKTIQSELAKLEAALCSLKPLIRLFDRIKQLERQVQRPNMAALESYNLVVAEIAAAKCKLTSAQVEAQRIGSAAMLCTYPSKIRDLEIFISTREQIARELNGKISGQGRGQLTPQEELDFCYEDFEELVISKEINPNRVVKENNDLQTQYRLLKKKFDVIESKVESDSRSILSEWRVVATTLSKIYSSSALDDQWFDVLIVDEASMVPMPLMYWALSKVKTAVTIVGDFKQLPPIVQSSTSITSKWLGRSIFEQLEIDNVEKARQNLIVSLLDTQYRMAPEIAAVSSRMFYGGLLKSDSSTKSLGLNDSIFGQNRLVIVDTSEVDPWCSSPSTGSRVNLYTAGFCVNLCQRLLAEHPALSVGIATPYRPHAELIGKAVDDLGLGKSVLVNTVHRFQGGEAQAIIFDCVDGKGSKRSILNDSADDFYSGPSGKLSSNAAVMLNVALTRARSLFVLVVNKQHYLNTQPESLLCEFIEELSKTGISKNSREIDGGFRVDDLLESSTWQSLGSVHNEKDFWSVFLTDLKAANESVCLVSPFITTRRTEFFLAEFEAMICRGVELKIYTRPVAEHTQDHMKEGAKNVISELTRIGAQVIQMPKLHQKVVLVDDSICWEGSLNILSHKDTLEHMRRLEGRQMAAEVKRSLRLC